MKRYKYLFLVVLIVSCWSCADSGLEVEEDMLLGTELNAASDKLTVEDFLNANSPEQFKYATGKILTDWLGKRLMRKVKGIPYRSLILFVPILDQDGNLDMEHPGEFRYYGGGMYGYNYNILCDPDSDELLFHEFFHFFQNSSMYIQRSRNNEVEAYVAQYLYLKSKGKTPSIMNDIVFTKMIGKLASCIDTNTGNFLAGTNMEIYYNNYHEAVKYLGSLPEYSGEGWFELDVDKGTHPFPNIKKLLE